LDPRRKETELLQEELERLGEQINAECAEIGRRLSEAGFGAHADGELHKYLKNIEALRATIEGCRGDIAQIKGTDARAEGLRRAIEENQKKIRALDKERESRYDEIGEAAYRKFKLLGDDPGYRALFGPLLKLDAEIDLRREELRKLEAQEADRGLIEKLLKFKTRKVVVRGSIRKIERQKRGAYAEVGRAVAASEFMQRLSAELAPVIEFMQERRRAADALAERNSALAGEATQAAEQLKRLGAADDPADGIRQIERRIEDLSRELRVMHCWAGQHFVERDLRAALHDDVLSAKFALIGGVRRTIQAKKRRIEVLRAEIEMDELLKKEKGLTARRKQIEEEIRVKERQANVMEIELSMGRRRMEELKRVIHEGQPYTEHSPEPRPPELP
jgi:hypothetical protein